MAIGETILGAVLGVVLDRLASREVINLLRRSKIDQSVIEELKRAMLAAEKLLLDAEQKQITERPVKEWLDELQHWFCRAEEVMDEIATEARQSSLKSSHGTPSRRKKVRNFVPALWSSFSFNRRITRNMSEIVSALDRMLARNDVLGLRELSGGRTPLRDSRATSSVPEDLVVYGRDQDREKLLKFLLSEEAGGNSLRIAAIVGMGGIGKTTLAKMVFNDPTVQKAFELRAWVCISDQFDIHRVTKSILESINGRELRSESIDLNFLQNELRSKLGNKKFLLVLDDIWNENYNQWQTLRAPFLAGTNGSKIIVTTRNAKVANIMRANPLFSLEPLSDDDGWSLFSRHAFEGANLMHDPSLEHLGRKIVQKCGRLPLAIKALGGLLGAMCNIESWERILHSNIWDLPHDNNNVMPALWLSYYYLPPHLKRCFSYCAIFPEDHKISREQLVRLWMAENFLSDKEKRMDEEGFGYIDDLLSGSFLEPIDESYVMMHDLMHDLARGVFGNLLARPEPETPSKFARHFSYTGDKYDGITTFQAINGNKHLRSFLKLGTTWYCYLTDKVPSIIKPSFSCMRVLALSGYINLMLPELAECPKQLRYLDVSSSEIKRLPKWVSTLCNLQTLILSNCTKLEELPDDMWRLISLRHLDIRGASLVPHMPAGMGKLKDLRTLTDFVVGKDIGSHIQELSELKEIRGKFAIRQLQNVANPSDAGAVNLRNRTFIDDLELEFDYKVVYEECTELLESLKPCLDVKSLTIRGYGGATLPKWLAVGCAEYKEIKMLCLINCRYCSSLPPLGQLPSLKELTIEGMDGIQQVGHEFYGHNRCGLFPNLKSLSFRNMKGWQLWSNVDAEGGAVCFPRLKKLFLSDCPNLKGNLPVHAPSLVELRITRCVLLRRLLPTVPSAHVPMLQWERCPFPRAELPEALVVTSITYLLLGGLASLVKLPRELVILSSLRGLSIVDCGNLTSLADVQLPSSLKFLAIYACNALECLPGGMESLPSFQILDLRSCQHLLWLRGSSLPTSLRSLRVYNCNRWEFPISMERMQHYTCLKEPDLRHTSKHLVFFPLGIFPNLCSVSFENCEGLEKVYIAEGIEADNLVSLSNLSIRSCHALETVGKETGRGEATTELSAPNLAVFSIHKCEKLKPVVIEKEGEVLLPELRRLKITNSATGELPHGVRRSLLKFSYLESLIMDGLEVECFPVTGESLPTSLTKLTIKNFRKLRKLDGEALHRLKYLRELFIRECPELERLPEKELIPSLGKLEIHGCPKLERLPEKGLPPSLGELDIAGCPKLEKRCKPHKGKDWSKIHHIPRVVVNDNCINM